MPNHLVVFLVFIGAAIVCAQDFKSTFVQDDFLPIPLSAPLADSVIEGEATKQDPRCLQTQEFGNGTGGILRFFFNTKNGTCSTFLYSGEGGNQNNFLTEIDCLNNCYIDVNEGAPLKEEDVHMIINPNMEEAVKRCLLAGKGKIAANEKDENTTNCTEVLMKGMNKNGNNNWLIDLKLKGIADSEMPKYKNGTMK